MSYNFIIPGIACVYPGYDLMYKDNINFIGQRLLPGLWTVQKQATIWHEGEIISQEKFDMKFTDGKLISDMLPPHHVPRSLLSADGHPAFLETQLITLNGSGFKSNTANSPYIVYKAPGKKSYLGDNSWKYATPPVIEQIAAFGAYIDGYSICQIDRDKDYGESFILINPYRKTIIASILGFGGRSINNIKIPARSVRRISLEALLRSNERRFSGQVQLTANNRLITYDIRHSLADPNNVLAQEHLDPFRGDTTHGPAFSLFRQRIGRWLNDRGINSRR